MKKKHDKILLKILKNMTKNSENQKTIVPIFEDPTLKILYRRFRAKNSENQKTMVPFFDDSSVKKFFWSTILVKNFRKSKDNGPFFGYFFRGKKMTNRNPENFPTKPPPP